MKWQFFLFIIPLLGSCSLEHNTFRLADVTLKHNQPCISVSGDSTVKRGEAKLLALSVSVSDDKGVMHEAWQQNNTANPLYPVKAGECIVFNYHFSPDKEYLISVITAQLTDIAETKRLWSATFKMNDLARQ